VLVQVKSKRERSLPVRPPGVKKTSRLCSRDPVASGVKCGPHGGMNCHMDLHGPTTSVGTRTDCSVGPWDYSACATRHLMAWGARTTVEKYSDRKLYMSCIM
jgi:hypothetical protein